MNANTDGLSSALPDLRGIPLGEMPALDLGMLESTIGRALPGAGTAPVPVAAFQSSI